MGVDSIVIRSFFYEKSREDQKRFENNLYMSNEIGQHFRQG